MKERIIGILLCICIMLIIIAKAIYDNNMKAVQQYYNSTETMIQLIKDDYYCTHIADSITLNDYINPTFDSKFSDCKVYHEYLHNRTAIQDILKK